MVGAPEPVCVKLPGLNDMVDTYLRDVGGKVPEKDVLWLAIGGNDIFAAASDPSVIPKLISDVVGGKGKRVWVWYGSCYCAVLSCKYVVGGWYSAAGKRLSANLWNLTAL